MSAFDDPFDANVRLGAACQCGQHASQHEHEAAENAAAAAPLANLESSDPGSDPDALNSRVIQSAVMRALFPQDEVRRRFLRAVGASTAMAAVSSFFPLGAMEALAQDKRALEKKDLKIGFIAITCASPLIMADPLGFYRKEGLNVQLMKTAGWALIRDKMINKEHDASHFLSPMPLAISMGLGSTAMPMDVATIQNINGQAITLATKHKDKRDPKQWKGFKFAVPFEYSVHNFLLRYYVAEHGLDPDTDIQIRVTPPPEMVANLRAGNIDGFLGPDPFNQRAVYDEVGFIHILSKEIWDGHPCCAFGLPEAFIKENPNTFAALYRAVLTAAAMARDPKHRPLIAEVISPANYLNQPVTVLEQVLTGKFADGLGNVKNVPDRADFDPFPWQSMAVWMLTQMKRWGYVKGDVNYRQIAEKVFLATDARKRMAELGQKAPAASYAKFKVMGKEFDPAQPEKYLAGFAIRKKA
jgi:nitrate/nitrite transport system substrate-binding protein